MDDDTTCVGDLQGRLTQWFVGFKTLILSVTVEPVTKGQHGPRDFSLY